MSFRLYLVIISTIVLLKIEGKPVATGKLTERIEHLLNITRMESKYNNIVTAYVTSDPNLSTYKSQIMSFLNKFLSFQLLRPDIVKIYGNTYTLLDINTMIKFYSTPLGKKLIDKESKVELSLAQLIQRKIKEQSPKIVSWFQEELNKQISNEQFNQAIQIMNSI